MAGFKAGRPYDRTEIPVRTGQAGETRRQEPMGNNFPGVASVFLIPQAEQNKLDPHDWARNNNDNKIIISPPIKAGGGPGK